MTMMAQEKAQVREQVFPNGLTVVTEAMPHVRSVAVGLWVRHGSRNEPEEMNGISHFIEHMVFKGTERRTAEDIARESDRIGGALDAFTGKEMTCFQIRVLDEHLLQGFDLLTDLCLRPLFLPEEIEREKSVILEEIRMVQDNPEDLVHENLTQRFWGSHALGRPILGVPETVQAFTREGLLAWFSERYGPENLLVTAAGNLSHEQIVDLAGAAFGTLPRSKGAPPETNPHAEPHITLRTKHELEQVHICLAVPGVPLTDPRRYAVSLMNVVLGTGMSSRLFQKIREKQGLAYAVFSDVNPYRDTGMLTVYAGTALETAGEVVRSVLEEFQGMRSELVSEEELRRAKDNLRGATLLALESSGSRMSRLARQYLYFGRFFETDELLAQLECVTREAVQDVAREFFRSGRVSASVLGNLNGFRLLPEQLAC
jgi:predicted Zn-dependent peptidase